MTKKDYQALAGALFAARVPEGIEDFIPTATEMRSDILGRIADVLEAANPRFDRARFLEACETGQCKGMWKGIGGLMREDPVVVALNTLKSFPKQWFGNHEWADLQSVIETLESISHYTDSRRGMRDGPVQGYAQGGELALKAYISLEHSRRSEDTGAAEREARAILAETEPWWVGGEMGPRSQDTHEGRAAREALAEALAAFVEG